MSNIPPLPIPTLIGSEISAGTPELERGHIVEGLGIKNFIREQLCAGF